MERIIIITGTVLCGAFLMFSGLLFLDAGLETPNWYLIVTGTSLIGFVMFASVYAYYRVCCKGDRL